MIDPGEKCAVLSDPHGLHPGAVVDLATLERIPWSRSSDSLQRDSGSSLLLTSTAGVNDFSSARSDWADVFFWAG